MSECFIATSEVKPIVEKLIEKYPINLSEVDPEGIIYIRAPGKKRAVTIRSIPSPFDLVLSQRFVLTIHSNRFDNLDANRQAIAIFDELLRIKSFEEGKLSGYSVVANRETIEKWGTDWEQSDEELAVFED